MKTLRGLGATFSGVFFAFCLAKKISTGGILFLIRCILLPLGQMRRWSNAKNENSESVAVIFLMAFTCRPAVSCPISFFSS